MAGQVASMMESDPLRNACVKQGAAPNSPKVIADVSTTLAAPVPISRSACRPPTGTHSKCKSRIFRRRIARVAAMATPEESFGTASSAPSGIISTRVSTEVREVALIDGRDRDGPLIMARNAARVYCASVPARFCGQPDLGIDLHRLMAIRYPHLPILHGVLQVHVAGGKPSERLRSGMREIDDRQLVQSR